jgi:lipoprotein-anchoring transpeptidase ErfK/SrfK
VSRSLAGSLGPAIPGVLNQPVLTRFLGASLVALLGAPLPAATAAPASTAAAGHSLSLAAGRELVLDRRARRLLVLEAGRELRRFPVAVGRPGWETPVGQFRVIELVADPIWEHPATGARVPPGPDNPLGSRWIGFHRDCRGRSGFNGVEVLTVEGCVSSGFHGTPQRESVGRAVSHGCVRLFDEHVRELFELVQMGTPVTVLP